MNSRILEHVPEVESLELELGDAPETVRAALRPFAGGRASGAVTSRVKARPGLVERAVTSRETRRRGVPSRSAGGAWWRDKAATGQRRGSDGAGGGVSAPQWATLHAFGGATGQAVAQADGVALGGESPFPSDSVTATHASLISE